MPPIPEILIIGLIILIAVILLGLFILLGFWRRVEQGRAIVCNGPGSTRVSFRGMAIVPIIHQAEYMDISVKRLEIDRHGPEGLICKDNLRADIQVAFFVRVNPTSQDVLKVAQAVGCKRAADIEALRELFDAKFSEALKTVGRQFDFVELYNSREQFRDEILKIIGNDLNGYILDDCAIDYLEQTPLESLNPNNILDSEGIKKITDLTAQQLTLANQINREKEKTIRQQDVEAEEAILELNRQLAAATEKQKREIAEFTAREDADAARAQHEARLRSEQARIATDEEVAIAEENRLRQIVVAQKNKERTEAVETERVEKDRMLEATERVRIVTLAEIEKERAVETEQRKIQDVIRERVMVERAVVEEREKIKDTEAEAAAEREKSVALIHAEREAQERLTRDVKAAEASRQSAELKAAEEMMTAVKAAEARKAASQLGAEEKILVAEATQAAAEKEAAAKTMLAEATAAEAAAPGLGEVKVMEARASATEKEGTAEARVMTEKLAAEARGITQKAEAMKLLDGVGREHEEFKLQLGKEKEIELARIEIQRHVAQSQAEVLGEALKSAKIDIVGGETSFFDKVVGAISAGKSVDRLVENSSTLGDVKATFFNRDPEYFRAQVKNWMSQFGVTTEDVKHLTVAAAIQRMLELTDHEEDKNALQRLQRLAESIGVESKKISHLLHG